MEWSTDPEVLRLIFLVGDMPPHMDYDNDVSYVHTCATAADRDITINTLLCCGDPDAQIVWERIAESTNGLFAQIAQDGNSQTISTRYDGAIVALNLELDATIIPYGSRAEQSNARSNRERLLGLTEEAVAERSSYFGKSGGGAVMSGAGDLVALLLSGELEMSEIDEAQLPAALRALDTKARVSEIRAQVERRQALQETLTALIAKRDAVVEEEIERLRSTEEDVIELNAFQVIEEQAERKGFRYSSSSRRP